MKEKPHQALLNREEQYALVEKHLSDQTGLLRDLADYGSNLIIRAYDSSPKKMTELITCGVLLKQIVSMVDAAEVLLSAGCGNASFLPARTAFEASIYIDWIFESQSETRATRYIVANYRDERLWANRVIPGTPEEIDFTKISSPLGSFINVKRPNLASEAANHLTEVNRILAQAELAIVDQEFSAARGKRKRDPEWYELDGLKSIRQLAEKVGRLSEYETFYSRGSQITHTGTYKDHIRFSDGQVRFKPIRHLADINMILNFLVSTCLGTYEKILKTYRPGEMTAFSKKYVEDWRKPFINVTSISYNF